MSKNMDANTYIRQISRIMVLDFETTGLNAQYDYIMQIGAVIMEGGIVLDSFNERISLDGTEAKISLKALAVQGGDLKNNAAKAIELMFSGGEKAAVFKRFFDWCQKNDTVNLPVVGQNAIYFDSGFWSQLSYQCRGIHKGQPMLGPLWIDTKDMATRVFPGSKVNLDAICQSCGMEARTEGHDALDDCKRTGAVFFAMKERMGAA